jgi:hypothetical protein
MKSSIAPRSSVLLFAMSVLLAGCGGGGGDLGSSGVAGTGGVADSGGVPGGGAAAGNGAVGGAADTAADGGVSGSRGTLIGHMISTTDFHGAAPDQTQLLGPVDTIVGDAVELTNQFFAGFATIDFFGASIRITAATDQPFGYFEVLRFADTNGTISPIASVSVDPATNYAGFNASRLNFTADLIDVNLTALSGQSGQQILLNIVFAAP